MQAILRKFRKNAFTLIELLVVISIIAILAALLVPAVTKAMKKGKMTGVMANGRSIYIAAFGASLDDPLGLGTAAAAAFPTNGTASSTVYFNSMITNGTLNVRASFFSGPGMVPAGGTNLIADANVWNVTLGFDDTTMDGTPFLFTRNYVISQLPGTTVLTPSVLCDTPTAKGLSFAKDGICVVVKGGSAFILMSDLLTTNFCTSGSQTNNVAKP